MEARFEGVHLVGVEESEEIFGVIESILFVCGEPIKLDFLAEILEMDKYYVEEILNCLEEEYTTKKRGIKLIRLNDSYQLVTKSSNSSYVQKLLNKNERQSISQGALEVLAIIAYKQPITRIGVDEIRGVNSGWVIQMLQDKQLIEECGKLDVPGRPKLYRTTNEFLRYFNIKNLDELESIEKFSEDLEGEMK